MRVMARLKDPHFQMTWMQRLEPCNKHAWSPQHSSSLDGSKRMRCTTTRKQEVDPNEHSQTAMLAKNKRNGSILEDAKQTWNFITLFLDCSLVPLHKDASHK